VKTLKTILGVVVAIIILTIWVVGVDKRYINKMKQLPMDEESDKS